MLFNVGVASFVALVTTLFVSFLFAPTLRREGQAQALRWWRLGAFGLCFVVALSLMLYVRS